MCDEYKPFDFVFTARPEILAIFLDKEAWQTRAFVLSFAPNADYVEKVTAIYNNAEFTELVKNYLINVEDEDVIPEFIREIERVLEKKIAIFSTEDGNGL